MPFPAALDVRVDSTPMATVHADDHNDLQKVIVGPVYFNAKGYGAIGDNATDDTTAIQAAITAASAVGMPAYLPPGTYRTTAQLTIDADGGGLIGAGPFASILTPSTAAFTALKVGNRQVSGTMRNGTLLQGFKVQCAGGASTSSGVLLDGIGYGSAIRNVTVTDGGYGFRLKDLDRVAIEGCYAGNQRTANVLLEQGTENTYGTVTFRDCSFVLSDASSTCVSMQTASEQGAPNRVHTLAFDSCLFFATAALATTTGYLGTVGADALNFRNCLFENTMVHIDLIGQSTSQVDGCQFLQNDTTASTACVRFATNTHYHTWRSNVAQKADAVFARPASGTPHVVVEGRSLNNGNLSAIFSGSFGSKMGTDVTFAGADTLALGLSATPFDYLFSNKWQSDEQSDPTAPSANNGIAYFRDNGSGKTQLAVRFPTGAVQSAALEP